MKTARVFIGGCAAHVFPQDDPDGVVQIDTPRCNGLSLGGISDAKDVAICLSQALQLSKSDHQSERFVSMPEGLADELMTELQSIAFGAEKVGQMRSRARRLLAAVRNGTRGAAWGTG